MSRVWCKGSVAKSMISKFFSPLIVFSGPEVLLFIYSSAAPQRTAYSEVTIPEGSPSKDWQSTVEIAGWKPRTAGLQSGVATNEPPLFPKSHP
jgi:hypothetical protein